jgi:dipeptidyl aminopeptidase/acylaminoacyl peptidase
MAYVSDEEAVEQFNLYSVTSNGSERNLLNSRSNSSGNTFQELRWSNNNNFIVFSADQNTTGVIELYSVQPNGSNLQKLNGDFVSGGTISDGSAWKISPDSLRVSYQANQDNNTQIELYTVPIDRSAAPTPISNIQTDGGNVLEHNWSNTGAYLLYRADEQTDDVFELYKTNPDGSGSGQVNPSLVNGGDVVEFSWLRS